MVHEQTQSAVVVSSPATITLTLTAGNAVIVSLHTYTGGTGPAQTAGDTLVLRQQIDDADAHTFQYSNFSVVGGSTTFTFTYGGVNFARLFVSEFSGGLNEFDVSSGAQLTNSASHSSGTTAATAQAEELAYANFNADGSGTTSLVSISNDFIIPTNGNQLAGATMKGLVAYKILASIGAQETTLVTGDVIDMNAAIGTYKVPQAVNVGGEGTILFPRLRW